MKKIIYLTILLIIIFAACQKEEYNFGMPPSGFDFSVDVDPKNTLKIKLTPTLVDTPRVRIAWDVGFGIGAARKSILFSPSITFPAPGMYTVTMIVYNDGGISNLEKSIEVKLPPGPNISPDLQVLASTNPLGKAWIVNRWVSGHSSAGRPANKDDITSIWSRGPENMACLGMYNDVYIFKAADKKLNDNEFILSTGGDVYTRQNYDKSFSLSQTTAQAGCTGIVPAPVLSTADRKGTYEAPTGLTYNLITRPSDERKVIKISKGGYLGMWIDSFDYEAIVFTPDSLTLKVVQPGNSVAWGVKLIPLPSEYLLLTGGGNNGKTWVVAKSLAGHSGAGNPDGRTPNIWSRNPNSLECLGLYNDEYNFNLNGLKYTLNTGGDIYTRAGLDSIYSNKKTSAQVCLSGSTVSGNDRIAFENAPANLTWTMQKKNGKTYISVSKGGYIGMDVQALEYEIVTLTEELLELRFLQKDGTVAWYLKLVPKS
jgi:PKD repeat protein